MDSSPPPPSRPPIYRFGRFEFDPHTGELRKGGSLQRLRQQPARMLALLLERAGTLVTREELRAGIWDSDTFVDFDQGMNYCVKEIRSALGDRATAPIFLETLPRRGYRWVAPLQRVESAPIPGAATDAAPPAPGPSAATQPVDPPARLAPVARRRWRARGALLLGLALLAGVSAILLQQGATGQPPRWQRVSFRRGVISTARFAGRDGLAYAAGWDGGPRRLYTSTIGALEALQVAEAHHLVAVTRRGDAYYLGGSDGRTLIRAPLAGGTPKLLSDLVVAADVGRDGETLAVARAVRDGKGVRLEFPLGREIARLNAPRDLRLAPDGRRVALVEHPVAGDDAGHVVVFDAAGRARVVGGAWSSIEGLTWAPGGQEVWVAATRTGADTSIHAIPVGSGPARLVLSAGGRVVLHDIAEDGRLLVERATSRPQMFFGSESSPERELTWLDGSLPQDLSADGKLLLFTETGEAGGQGSTAFVRATDGSPPVRLGPGRALSLAPDSGSALLVPAPHADHLRQVPIGPGVPQIHRIPGITSFLWAALLPDGRFLFTGAENGRQMRAWLTRTSGAPQALTAEQRVVTRHLLSPDGRWLVAACPPAATCLHPVEGGEPRPIAGLADSLPLRWDSSGRLLVAEVEQGGSRIVRLDPATGVRSPVRSLVPADPVGASRLWPILTTPDARAWVYAFLRRLSDLYVVELP